MTEPWNEKLLKHLLHAGSVLGSACLNYMICIKLCEAQATLWTNNYFMIKFGKLHIFTHLGVIISVWKLLSLLIDNIRIETWRFFIRAICAFHKKCIRIVNHQVRCTNSFTLKIINQWKNLLSLTSKLWMKLSTYLAIPFCNKFREM